VPVPVPVDVLALPAPAALPLTTELPGGGVVVLVPVPAEGPVVPLELVPGAWTPVLLDGEAFEETFCCGATVGTKSDMDSNAATINNAGP
jgi:hypothetical protein